MTEQETSITANEKFTNLLHEFSLHLLTKIEEMAHYVIIMERLVRDLGMVA